MRVSSLAAVLVAALLAQPAGADGVRPLVTGLGEGASAGVDGTGTGDGLTGRKLTENGGQRCGKSELGVRVGALGCRNRESGQKKLRNKKRLGEGQQGY